LNLASLSFSGYRSHSSGISSFVFSVFQIMQVRFATLFPWKFPPTDLEDECTLRYRSCDSPLCPAQWPGGGLDDTGISQKNDVVRFLNIIAGVFWEAANLTAICALKDEMAKYLRIVSDSTW